MWLCIPLEKLKINFGYMCKIINFPKLEVISNLFPHLYRPNKQKCSCQTETSWKKMLPKTFQNTLLSRKNLQKTQASIGKKKKIVIFSKTFWRNAMTLSSKLSNKVGKIYLMKIQTFWEKRNHFWCAVAGCFQFQTFVKL